ncbi:MAG: hypothetical protein ACJ8FS_17085 [Sphingomicrobium sp.]
MKDADKDKGKPDNPGTIAVTVHYQSKTESHGFKPGETVEDVLDWALKVPAFGIDAAMASEFELARHGQTEELPLGDHLAKLATGAKLLELDLVRGDIANGASA